LVRVSGRFVCAGFLALFVATGPVSCAKHTPPAVAPAPPPAPAATPAPVPSPPAPAPAPAPTPAPARLPDRLSDAEFWKLIGDLSEPGGQFRSDNLLSNEVWLQHVIPELLDAAKPGRVYMGVGPEQNFTYIAALKPAMAIIVDVRRGNLQMHLMYKALFEMSADRADFVSRLFSRKRPAGLTAASSVREIFQAFAAAPFDETRRDLPQGSTWDQPFEDNFKAIIDHLQKTHGFALDPGDAPGIRYIYEFFGRHGPDLTYWMSGVNGGRGGFRNSPTYADLAVATDAAGVLRGYLASEEHFNTLKALESKNLLVPVVGNFAGPKAIRAVGAWLKAHNGMVSAFYLSNVEQYLQMDGIWYDFCANAARLPIDETSQFIRSFRGGGPGFGGGGASLNQGLNPMMVDLKQCAGQ
jgi:hypothetical protein